MIIGGIDFFPMKRRIGLLLLPPALLMGCSRNPDGPAIVTPSPPPPLTDVVSAAALQRGKAIALETFSLLSSNLQTAIQQGGVSNALPFCSIAALPLTSGMAAKHGVTIRRVTHKPRSPSGQANAVELGVLQQFREVLAGTPTNPPSPIVTNLAANTATFFAPIVLNNELCLKCHGEPGKDISPENVAVIQRLYPQDAATGFRLGELRGAWRIDFPLATLSSSP